MTSHSDRKLHWQSKAVLLLVLPWSGAQVILQAHYWFTQVPSVAALTLGISALFGLIVWKLRAATPAAAFTGAVIAASLIFSTASFPYPLSWLHGALLPLLAVFLLTYIATKIGRAQKDRLGTSESRRGRNAAQVAANLGIAALAASLIGILEGEHSPALAGLLATAALAEAAADTVSSEIGQVFGGQPRMLTTFRKVEPGTDGAITLVGTLAGILAAATVAAISCLAASAITAHPWDWLFFTVALAAAVFGLLFDSLLGATLEPRNLGIWKYLCCLLCDAFHTRSPRD